MFVDAGRREPLQQQQCFSVDGRRLPKAVGNTPCMEYQNSRMGLLEAALIGASAISARHFWPTKHSGIALVVPFDERCSGASRVVGAA
jgi:hypothetical protein